MAVDRPSLMPATARPLGLRMRPDLIVSPQHAGRHRCWTVKDPLALRFYQLQEDEYAILRMLDGRVSLNEVRRRFEAAFAPRRLTAARLQAFLRDLHRKGLILAEATAQGLQLLKRREQHRRRRQWQTLTSPRAIRFRGIDAQPVIARLEPWCRWMFSPAALAAAVLVVVAALVLVAVQFETLLARLPAFDDFFTAGNALWLIVVLALVKVLHELGHALTLHHYGGESHEMGLMLLAFTPSLYCNVSDAWMFPSKRQRIAVTAAGMAVELVLAAIATLLWWFSRPGLFHLLCLDVMFLCSVSTLLFNGNPLLKYDGYYILADLAEVPNLGERASAALRAKLSNWFFEGDMAGGDDPQPDPGWLPLYALASLAYRWFVVLTFCWFLHQVLEPTGFHILADVLFVWVVATMTVPAAVNAVRRAADPLARRQPRPFRAAAALLLLLAALALIGFLPLPRSVTGPVVLELKDAASVYVTVSGRLTAAVVSGRSVARGEVLARLRNPELERKLERLSGDHRQQELRLAHLEARRGTDPAAAAALPAAREALDDLRHQLDRLRAEQRQLTLRAPVAGTVLPPPNVLRTRPAEGELPEWWGTPLDARNRDLWLDRMLFCRVGDPQKLEAIVLVEQSDVEFVGIGQPVTVRLDQRPGESLKGTVVEVARREVEIAPRELSDGTALPVQPDALGRSQPFDVRYEVRIEFSSPTRGLIGGGRGRAKIAIAAEPLGPRLLRAVRRTFRFAL